jgi:hypothetical protein
MTGRRIAAAAVTTLAAVAVVLVPAGTATAGTPGRTTARTTTNAVALQVQYPDSTTRTWCVPYRAGMTGADVLSVATPTYGKGPYAGFVLKITGQGTTPPTDTTYWAYWRSATGTAAAYAYATTGVGSAQPAAGSVEAWIWNTSATTTPRKASYTTLCPNGA